jgi:hypothetical protein
MRVCGIAAFLRFISKKIRHFLPTVATKQNDFLVLNMAGKCVRATGTLQHINLTL